MTTAAADTTHFQAVAAPASYASDSYQQQQQVVMMPQQQQQQQYSTAAGGYSQYATHAEFPIGSRMVTGQTIMGQERVQTTRKVSSTVVDEQFLGPMPQDYPVREVEVPGPIQEVIKHVPRKEVVETEKRVPRYEYEWVERIVEVPRIEYIDRTVEVPQYKEVVREVRVPQIIEVPKEVIREVKVPQVKYVDKVREVPGEIIEVPKPYPVEQKIEMTRYVDRMHPVVVAQTVKPYIVDGAGTVDVDVYEYEPECIPVDVHVIRAVQAQIEAAGVVESTHKVISIPAAQYNTVLQQLNVHLSQAELNRLPYMQENGQTAFVGERVSYTEPQVGTKIIGLDPNNMINQYVDQASRRVVPIPGVTDAAGNLLPQHQITTTTTHTQQQYISGGIQQTSYTQQQQQHSKVGTTTTAGSSYMPASSAYGNVPNVNMTSANYAPASSFYAPVADASASSNYAGGSYVPAGSTYAQSGWTKA